MKTISVNNNRTIILPKSIFKPNDKVAVITDGDTVILKKINQPKLSNIAYRTKEKVLTLAEIAKETHQYRKTKKP
jgi:virulence-associated protein VagC